MSSLLSSSQSSAGRQQRPAPEPACPVLLFWKVQHQRCSLPSALCWRGTRGPTAKLQPRTLSCRRHQQEAAQPPAPLGLYFEDNTDVGKRGPTSRLQLKGEVSTLENNAVQKPYDEWLLKQSEEKEQKCSGSEIINLCLTLGWLFPLEHAVCVFPEDGH